MTEQTRAEFEKWAREASNGEPDLNGATGMWCWQAWQAGRRSLAAPAGEPVAILEERDRNLHRFLSSHEHSNDVVTICQVLDHWKTDDEKAGIYETKPAPPPETDHWLMPFWRAGAEVKRLRAIAYRVSKVRTADREYDMDALDEVVDMALAAPPSSATVMQEGAVKICPERDVACAEVPVAARCRECLVAALAPSPVAAAQQGEPTVQCEETHPNSRTLFKYMCAHFGIELGKDTIGEAYKKTTAVFRAASPAPAETLPHPGSPEASAMMDSLLAEYNWPTNTKNAARAGYEAARRLLGLPPPSPVSLSPAPAAGTVPQWMPIETAPRDSSVIWLWCANAYMSEHRKVGMVNEAGEVYAFFDDGEASGMVREEFATHWMRSLPGPDGS